MSRPEEMPIYSFDIILKTLWINFSPALKHTKLNKIEALMSL